MNPTFFGSHRLLLDNQSETLEGFQCDGKTIFQENERASDRLETPVFFRFSFHD